MDTNRFTTPPSETQIYLRPFLGAPCPSICRGHLVGELWQMLKSKGNSILSNFTSSIIPMFFFVFFGQMVMPKKCYKNVSSFTGENDALQAVCVCVDHHHHSSRLASSKSPYNYHHPIVNFQSSTQQPSTLPDYLQKNRSADGIQYNSLLPKKCSKKTTSTMLIHPPTLSSIIMGSVENYPKNSGKRSWYRRYTQKFHWTMMGGEGIQPIWKICSSNWIMKPQGSGWK